MMKLQSSSEQLYFKNLFNRIIIKNNPPFTDYLSHFLLTDNRGITTSYIKNSSRQYEKTYLVWQAIRHLWKMHYLHINPDIRLTGFEPYFIGLGYTPFTIYKKIEEIGKNQLAILKKDTGFGKTVYETLNEEKTNLSAFIWLNDTYNNILTKLEIILRRNKVASNYKNTAYQHFSRYQPIEYKDNGMIILEQTYKLPSLPMAEELQLPSKYNYKKCLDPSDPYGFMWKLGKVGHPLVKTTLDLLDYLILLQARNFIDIRLIHHL